MKKNITDHKGNMFSSIAAMCNHWNIPRTVYDGRIHMGWTQGEALSIPVGLKSFRHPERKVTDHEGNVFDTVDAMCRHWKIPTDTYYHRIKREWSQKDALSTQVGEKRSVRAIDHEGNSYPSIEAMCNHWEIPHSTYINRLNRGWTSKDALTIPKGAKNTNFKQVVDHEGREFVSIGSMCKYWNISRRTYSKRIEYGWAIKDALTTPVGEKNKLRKPITDHDNNEFSSIKGMCQHWGISISAYNNRIRLGWTQEAALTTPISQKSALCKPVVDHEYNQFSSIKGMCKHWNIPCSTYNNRLNLGWSLKRTLTTPVKKKLRTVTDHKENEYPSVTAMCKYWKIPKSVYIGRIKLGWSQADALTMPVGSQIPNAKSITDHKGNQFPSIQKMCKYWHIDKSIYRGRIKLGWSMEDALTKPIKKRK